MYSNLHPENPVRLMTKNIYADLEHAIGELFIYADEATFDNLRQQFKRYHLPKFIAEIQQAKSLAISRAIQRRKTDQIYSE